MSPAANLLYGMGTGLALLAVARIACAYWDMLEQVSRILPL